MTNWIPTDRTLPDDETLVLLAFKDGDVWPGYRDGHIWRDAGAMPLAHGIVQHWAPIPPSPAEQAHQSAVRETLRELIACDEYAATFQSFGQYRAALLKHIDNRATAEKLAMATLNENEGIAA